MNKSDQLWKSLEDEEYREAFIADDTGLAFQIKMLRDKNGWTQEELGKRAGGKKQETISQWENPNYGRYSLSTLKDLATAFDVALVRRFAPFSEVVEWHANLTPERIAPPSFNEEKEARRAVAVFVPGIGERHTEGVSPVVASAFSCIESTYLSEPTTFTISTPDLLVTTDIVTTTVDEPRGSPKPREGVRRALAA